jgi:ribosome biogenesis GTPase A
MLLAMVGTIKADLIPLEAVADFGLSLLIDKYPDRLKNRYDLEALSVDQRALFHKIGINRGCLLQGGGIDYDRVYKLFLHDLRNQLLGPMTFERITDNVSL